MNIFKQTDKSGPYVFTGSRPIVSTRARVQPPTATLSPTLRLQTPPLFSGAHAPYTPGCAPLKRRRHSPAAHSTCADTPVLRSSPLGPDRAWWASPGNMSADMLFLLGLLAVMPPTICCVRSQSARDLVTEISAVPRRHRCGVAQSPSSELATQACPSHEPAP